MSVKVNAKQGHSEDKNHSPEFKPRVYTGATSAFVPGGRFDKNDCRSLFDQIDYVIFEGVNKTGNVQRIIFTDIK